MTVGLRVTKEQETDGLDLSHARRGRIYIRGVRHMKKIEAIIQPFKLDEVKKR